MQKLGRNDPCHCGSGKKYKKCCLSQDQAGNITRVTAARKEPSAVELIGQLNWADPSHQLVAIHFAQRTISDYPDDQISYTVRYWHDYSFATNPTIRKVEVFPAVLEYFMGQVFEYGTTQAALAKKYGVTVNTISQRFAQMVDYHYDKPTASAPVSNSRMAMEQQLAQLTSMIKEQQFETKEEVEKFLSQHLNSPTATQKSRKKLPKKEQAQDMLYEAWNEGNPARRTKLAQEALLLDPDLPDAYNILAEDAPTPKEMAYLHKQGMLAGERSLGQAYFREERGRFWGIVETRPYMRAKKGYAEACAMMGNLTEAIQHYKELLELNPNDNQGVRDLLLSAYIEEENWKDADSLIMQYEGDTSATFNYNRILVEYGSKGKSAKLKKLIDAAWAQNRFVPAYLTGKKTLPRQMPEYYGYGDDPEAIVYALLNRHLWVHKPELLALLSAGK